MESLVGTELERVDKDWTDLNDEKARIVATIVKAKNPSKVLDIGVFTGVFWKTYYPDLLRRSGVYGVDILDEFLQVSSERGIHTTKCNVDTDALPYADNTFDFVMCEGLLEHTLRPKPLLSEIHRVLRPGGTLLVSIPSATTAVARWRMLRGDSPFHPLIDNLFTRDFQKRCAVFYSPADLRWVEPPRICRRLQLLRDWSHDERIKVPEVLGRGA